MKTTLHTVFKVTSVMLTLALYCMPPVVLEKCVDHVRFLYVQDPVLVSLANVNVSILERQMVVFFADFGSLLAVILAYLAACSIMTIFWHDKDLRVVVNIVYWVVAVVALTLALLSIHLVATSYRVMFPPSWGPV